MLLFLATMILFSLNCFASFDCQTIGTFKAGYRLVIVERVGAPSTVTIQHKGQTTYHKGVVGISEPKNGMSYRSLGFTNKNNAPAGLFLNIYKSGCQILGNFNEGSYLPVVPSLQFICKQF